MQKFSVRYQRCPTNFNDPATAIVEADSPEAARTLVKHQLGDIGHVNNYDVDLGKPYTPPPGKILTMNG